MRERAREHVKLFMDGNSKKGENCGRSSSYLSLTKNWCDVPCVMHMSKVYSVLPLKISLLPLRSSCWLDLRKTFVLSTFCALYNNNKANNKNGLSVVNMNLTFLPVFVLHTILHIYKWCVCRVGVIFTACASAISYHLYPRRHLIKSQQKTQFFKDEDDSTT